MQKPVLTHAWTQRTVGPVAARETKEARTSTIRGHGGACRKPNLLLGRTTTLDNIPSILAGVAEFGAGDRRTKAKVANRDGIILELVGKVVAAAGHRTYEDADTFARIKALDIVADAHNRRVPRKGDLAAVGWQVVSDGISDDLEQLLLRVGRTDREAMQ